MGGGSRTILHVDLDAFFAAVEQRDDPSLRGRPVLVGGSVKRGVVAAASYEARRFGVFSAMPMAEAMRRCPDAIVVPHRFERYHEASRTFFRILADYSPLVESLSLDEAFVDITGSERLLGDGVTIARDIKRRVRQELELVASIGVAPTKFAAKIGSDIDKPDGLRVIAPGELLPFLHALPVARLWGAGEVTQRRLTDLGLSTIGDVARYPAHLMTRHFGPVLGQHLAALARGEDGRDVMSENEPVSIGHEETFDSDIGRHQDLAPILIEQAERVASRLREANLRARVVVVKVKHADFRLVTRRRTLEDPTSDGARISPVALALAGSIDISDVDKHTRVRLCGVAVSGLEPRDAPRQLALDEGERQRGERLGDTLDAVRRRFGGDAIARGPASDPSHRRSKKD